MPVSLDRDTTLLAFKAGRAFRQGTTNTVVAEPAKGAIVLTNGEDGLLHFLWKNRDSDIPEEDLIIFPTDATFTKVAQSSGRVYVLKFSSSDQRHFFWMQDASPDRDEEFARNVNSILDDPEIPLQWGTSTPAAQASSSTSAPSTSAPAAPATANPTAAPSAGGFQATPEQLEALQNLIRAGGSSQGPSGAAGLAPDMSLIDVLTPANLTPLFASHPELVPTLFPYLPSDLPVTPSAEVLERIVHSPQFRASVASFDQALRTGLLGGFVQQLGLPAEAGLGIGPFLKAIQEQADKENREGGTRMDTD